ncbi:MULTISPECIES: M48 family metallopeptidase [unclassified Brevundimonas]|uniref:M48 family metallopeptidase n=1 Tax=unclassified Brevundimonas TaxID=2622653 RepID=UPI0025BF1121|nr:MULTISPECIES: M48 family metallopeptidase [unclassified Brevundimonas]
MKGFGPAVGIKTFIWQNNARSALLLAGFPVLLVMLVFAVNVLAISWGLIGSSGGALQDDLVLAADNSLRSIPVALLGAVIWFAIAYFGQQSLIDAITGARPVSRTAEPQLYNLLENLCISRGITMPSLRIIETHALNAYASGLHDGQYCVTVTRGLLERLDRDELECVLAHELTHILNRDVRTMVIASIFAGIISVVAEIIFRALFHSGRGRRGGDSKNAVPLMLIGLAIGVIGYGLAIVIRMSLSRTREYVADAGAVELTKNPDAMISALRKVSGVSAIKAPEELRGMLLDNTADKSGFSGLFATHPPIERRIAALIEFSCGRDIAFEREAAAYQPQSTSVPLS